MNREMEMLCAVDCWRLANKPTLRGWMLAALHGENLGVSSIALILAIVLLSGALYLLGLELKGY